MIRPALVGLSCLVLGSCNKDKVSAADASGALPVERTIPANGVKLHVVDWGGAGPALVFLHGLGDNTHTFDELAPAFTDRYHVYAFDRRGHGDSELQRPFDIETLVNDLSVLLDSLEIRSVSLVGHSMAGYELIRFATRYPDRTAALVFLDAGYDFSDSTFAAMLNTYPVSYVADSAALASPGAYVAWYHAAYWRDLRMNKAMLASAAGTFELVNGRVEPKLPDSLVAAFLESLRGYRPEYDSVKAPALVILARWPLSAIVPPAGPDSIRRKVADWLRNYARPVQEHALSRFRDGMRAARVVVLDSSNHYVMFARPDTVLAEMRAFLNPSPSMAHR